MKMVEETHDLVGGEEEKMIMLKQEKWFDLVVMKKKEDDGEGEKKEKLISEREKDECKIRRDVIMRGRKEDGEGGGWERTYNDAYLEVLLRIITLCRRNSCVASLAIRVMLRSVVRTIVSLPLLFHQTCPVTLVSSLILFIPKLFTPPLHQTYSLTLFSSLILPAPQFPSFPLN
ncbi:hypothetical protein RJT34_16495 [Clitoria ternatea]|uniref:Uncharacterized protein n=1 Tax=Clitoria ternatea TaxID=43366 RepID=A0AAN9J8F7_CLITE